MPSIQSLRVEDDIVEFTDSQRIRRTLLALDIPDRSAIARVENYINNTWFPSVTDGSYQIIVHVIGLNPIKFAVVSADKDIVIRGSWWDRSNN